MTGLVACRRDVPSGGLWRRPGGTPASWLTGTWSMAIHLLSGDGCPASSQVAAAEAHHASTAQEQLLCGGCWPRKRQLLSSDWVASAANPPSELEEEAPDITVGRHLQAKRAVGPPPWPLRSAAAAGAVVTGVAPRFLAATVELVTSDEPVPAVAPGCVVGVRER
eukprot:CAMPEP_0171103784 /NCGR_PEP_ID=MMETSP0766_2-20121228/59382_1 /TAXON_ID=439317 /ORGANISM="Gambierdiscus australes, Strain CAWD 149" /LENGTH=164 /DNA_ID=CAMNT_0011564275 /DNA_START=383 /DNA_END=879 /DNA_ORIENTATION=-